MKSKSQNSLDRGTRSVEGVVSPAQDLPCGIFSVQIWLTFALHDIKQRYRRSTLGPFWFVLSNLIFISVLGVLYAGLFGQDVSTYLPYLAVGFIVWQFMASSMNEGSNSMVEAAAIIKQVNVPLSVHPMRVATRNFIILLHNVPLIVFFPFFMGVELGLTLIIVPVAFILLFLNSVLVCVVLGLAGARYRDIQPLTQNLTTILFFFTPILWQPEILSERAIFVDLNPFHHFIQIIRMPMLGEWPPFASVAAVLIITAIGLMLGWGALARFKNQLAFWV